MRKQVNLGVGLMPYNDWMKKTSITLGVRGKDLESVDKHLQRFHHATTDYGKEWEANEVRIALDIYFKKNPKWKDSDRNKSGAFSKMDQDLSLMGLDTPQPAGQDGATATNLRLGVLYFLSNLKSDVVPADWSTFINDTLDASSDVHDALRTGQQQGGVRSTLGTAAGGLRGGGSDDASNGFLKSLIENLQDYIAQIAGPMIDLARGAINAIVNLLPEIVKTMLGAVLQNLGAAIEITKNLVQAGRAAAGVFTSRHLEEGVMSGHPRIVVAAVREQIKDSGWDGVKGVVKTALLTGASAANPVLGAVASAVASVYKFITDLWSRIKDRMRLGTLIKEATVGRQSNLHENAAGFNIWFKEAIKDLPILSCYCMCMPLTGSYYGFLTLVGTDNTQMSYETLERNYGEFNDVKSWARKFVKDCKLTLRSDNKLVQQSIDQALGKGESESRKGLAERAQKTVVSMIENVSK